MMRCITFILALLFFAASAHAGWLDSVKSGFDTAKGAADKLPKQSDGNNAAKNTNDSSQASASSGGENSADTAAGEVYGNEFDFVPGEKMLFFDDFSDTEVGDYPLKWKRGGGHNVEIVEYGGKHWLRQTPGGGGSSSQDYIRSSKNFQLPQKFTVEFDAYVSAWTSLIGDWGNEIFRVRPGDGGTKNSGGQVPRFTGMQHIAVSVNGTYVKVYVGGRRVAMDPDGFERPLKSLGIGFTDAGDPKKLTMITNFRIAEGGKDYQSELVSLGRIVTHGITFDTGSDKIKPESGPTLRKILKLLQDDENLRFEVQGHTDNQGSKKINQPLSEKRATAVKTWLVNQGLSADRLQTKGLGDTKPIDKNDTAEGRANNRRVEFVKI